MNRLTVVSLVSIMLLEGFAVAGDLVVEGKRTYIPGLEEVPFGGYSGVQNSVVGAICHSMAATGNPVEYHWLMGLSGAAFKLQFSICSEAPHSEVGFCNTDLAFKALGYDFQRIDLNNDEKSDPEKLGQVKQSIVASIDKGIPVLLNGEECSIIVGHINKGEKFLVRHFAPGKGYKKQDGMPAHIILIGDKTDRPPSNRERVLTSLRAAVEMAESEEIEKYTSGYAAYERYMKEVVRENPGGVENYNWFGVFWTYGSLQLARESAAEYLKYVAEEFPKCSEGALAASGEYATVSKLLSSKHGPLPQAWYTPVGEDANQKWTQEMRQTMADVLRRALGHEKAAIGHVKMVIKALERI